MKKISFRKPTINPQDTPLDKELEVSATLTKLFRQISNNPTLKNRKKNVVSNNIVNCENTTNPRYRSRH